MLAIVSSFPVTHEVSNQPPVLEDYNLYETNHALQEAVARGGAGWAHEELAALGAELGSAAWMKRGDDANRNPPVMKPFDRFGHRTDTFEFHPAWHECMAWLKGHGVDTGAWAAPRPGAHVRRAALFQLFAEIEAGSLCPTTMTYGAVPPVSREPDLARQWMPLLLSPHYDERFIPAVQKRGVTMGMGLTEKQGGSDVRANTSRAAPLPVADPARSLGEGWHHVVGHKWFFSAPMCDAFLVTAQAPGGLTCFLMPRWTPDGKLNAIRFQRAKDKMGDRSNAGCEVEFCDALAHRIGEEGHGIRTVLEMATYTRMDCANGSAGLMRAALSQAVHHAGHRSAFGKRLLEQPLMRNVLADMALEVEAHAALAMRVSTAFDRQDDPFEIALRRILTPVAKYWVCKRAPVIGAEAMEVLGGNGYVEDGPMARLYRQMPLNAIWEGSGNIIGLDVLRAMSRHPEALDAVQAELQPALGRLPAFDRFVARLARDLADGDNREARARRLVEDLALALQGALLLRYSPDGVSHAFCASRLSGDWGRCFGTLPVTADFEGILRRAWPKT